ncbi:hypothetical protein HAX54_044794 [Datura stramonium]|uniref:Rhodanese domain-containing protein n=1 Tax=Datura stramonium TaxID=4076 RepID=A0ABS8WH62_DATST|nr:hypothetical protein [Datura stramonium]
MQALGHGLLPLGTLKTCQKEQRCQLIGSIHFLSYPVPSSLKFCAPLKYRNDIRMQAVQEEYELKQMKDMAAAKRRWDAMIKDGKVKVLTPREAGYAIQLSNKMLLDVRPSMERKKAWVKGSTWIPIFDVDTSLELGTLSQKATNFLMGYFPLPSDAFSDEEGVSCPQG